MSPTHTVPFFDQRPTFERDWRDVVERVEEVFAAGKYSHGLQVDRLERAIADYVEAPHAVGVNSGTDALALLLRAAGVGAGDEVVLPCFTWISPASMIARLGATPVFVDVEPGSYALDPAAVEAALTPRTRAILPVHLFNQMADMTAITAIARHHDVRVVEDSAEAIGMWQDGVHAGLHGSGGVLSFFPTKTLGTLGDAGMIITGDALIADRCRILRHHGRAGATVGRITAISNAAARPGTNSKMDEILAAVLLSRLRHLPGDVARRAALADRYDRALAPLARAGLVARPRLLARPASSTPVWYVYVVEAEDRDALATHLAAAGIGTEQYYPRPLHLQPCFAHLGGREGQHPVAEAACRRTLALPLYPDMTPARQDAVVSEIERFYRA